MSRHNRTTQFASRCLLLPTVVMVLGTIGVAGAADSKTRPTVTVGILSGAQASFREAVAAMRPILETAGARCVLTELPKGEKNSETDKAIKSMVEARPRLIITVGLQATSLALKSAPGVPILFSMVPNVLDAPFRDQKDSKTASLAGVTTDIAPAEQIAWILKLVPSLKNLTILYSDHSAQTALALKTAGQDRQVAIVLLKTEKEAFGDALHALGQTECDGVLMLPDAFIYNSVNVRELLLWGIRQKKVIWTFSDNLVKAGAFAGLFAEPTAVGRQTADVAKRILDGKAKDKPGLEYANPFQTAINEHTAEMIGVSVDEELLKSITRRYGKD